MSVSMLRSVPLSKKLENKKVGKDVRKFIINSNVLLLRANSVLSKNKIESLMKHGVTRVYVWATDVEYEYLSKLEKSKA